MDNFLQIFTDFGNAIATLASIGVLLVAISILLTFGWIALSGFRPTAKAGHKIQQTPDCAARKTVQ